jgi:hypothetical protein
VEIKPVQLSENKATSLVAKYEADFVDLEDPDNEGDDDSEKKPAAKPKQKIELEVVDKSRNEHEQ